MAESIDSIKKKFLAKAGSDKTLSSFFDIYLLSKPVGDDSFGQRFVITDKSLNSQASEINETTFLDLILDDDSITYRFTIPLLKKLGMDLALSMQEYLVNKK
jgi:hypothetical protein